MSFKDTPHGKLALNFALALLNGEYQEAYKMLTAEQQFQWSAEALQNEYETMIDYGGGPITSVELMSVMQDWPTKEIHDMGWAYVSIGGDGYSEAIAAVVCTEAGSSRIREIEWGRP